MVPMIFHHYYNYTQSYYSPQNIFILLKTIRTVEKSRFRFCKVACMLQVAYKVLKMNFKYRFDESFSGLFTPIGLTDAVWSTLGQIYEPSSRTWQYGANIGVRMTF